MAQYWIDFDDYSVGALPAAWPNRWATGETDQVVTLPDIELSAQTAGLGLKAWKSRGDTSASPRLAHEYVPSGTSAVQEIYSVVGSSEASSNPIPTLILRGGGTSEATRSGYVLFVRATTNDFQIRRKLSGSSSIRVSGTFATSYWSDAALAVRFRAEESGSNVLLTAKVWRFGIDDESEAVTITHTDTTPLVAGWVGIGSISVAGAMCFHGYTGIGTDGDPAPTGPVGGTRRRSPLLLTPW